MQDQFLLGATWAKIRKIQDILFIVGALFILLNLALSLAVIGKWLLPSPWIWVQLRIVTFACALLVCIRVLEAFVIHKGKPSHSDTYSLIGVAGTLALVLAPDQQDQWSLVSFPLLLIAFFALFIIEARLQIERRRIGHRGKNRLSLHREQTTLQKQKKPKTFRGAIREDNTVPRPSQKVFISYSHEDEKWVKQLHTHLKPLERQGMIELWDDKKIPVGTIRQEEIEYAIESSAAAIILVSPAFLGSDFITQYELPRLLWRSQMGGTIIFPLIVRSCLYEGSELGKFQAFNEPSKPLAKMTCPARDQILVDLAKAIYQRLGVRVE